MNKIKIFFRADGNSVIGLGHVYRALALLQMLDDSFESHFIIRDPSDDVENIIRTHCDNLINLETTDLSQEVTFLKENHLQKDDLFVLDGYDFGDEYEQSIRASGVKLICIDDLYEPHQHANVIINHGGAATLENYPNQSETIFCLGPKYALLRPAFWKAAQEPKQSSTSPSNLFICFGGADTNNDTLAVLKNLDAEKFDKCYVVVGAANKHKASLKDFREEFTLDVEIKTNLSEAEMVDIMKQCGTAITSASTIAYEYLSIGGELYIKQTADNQKHLFDYLTTEQLALPANTFPSAGQDKINQLIVNQNSVFDGLQAKRYNAIFKALSMGSRLATEEDMMLFFQWANEKTTRSQSFSEGKITLSGHVNWFTEKIEAEESTLLVITQQDASIGQVRFDKRDENWVISYSLDKDYRGKGLGTAILYRAITDIKKFDQSNHQIIAFVKKENVPSQKAFRLLGFKEEQTDLYPDSFQYTHEHGI